MWFRHDHLGRTLRPEVDPSTRCRAIKGVLLNGQNCVYIWISCWHGCRVKEEGYFLAWQWKSVLKHPFWCRGKGHHFLLVACRQSEIALQSAFRAGLTLSAFTTYTRQGLHLPVEKHRERAVEQIFWASIPHLMLAIFFNMLFLAPVFAFVCLNLLYVWNSV